MIGVGNPYRRDDGLGPAVLAELSRRRERDPILSTVECRVTDGEPARLLDLWTGVDLAVLVDAARDGGRHPGHRYEYALDEPGGPLPRGPRSTSSHGLGLDAAVALGHALGRLPRRLVLLAVVGTEFGYGAGLTPAVAAAVRPVADRVRALLAAA